MFSGVGFQELFLLFVIGLVILGPERLPRVASQIGRWVGRARRTANQLRFQLEREIALAELEKKHKPVDEQPAATTDTAPKEPEPTIAKPEEAPADDKTGTA